MRRKRKHREYENAVRSKFAVSYLCGYDADESPLGRHLRRYAEAKKWLSWVSAWCEYRGVTFSTKAIWYHVPGNFSVLFDAFAWQFTMPSRFAQWRPWAGKLTLKRDLRTDHYHVIKVYDAEQLLKALGWWMEYNDGQGSPQQARHPEES